MKSWLVFVAVISYVNCYPSGYLGPQRISYNQLGAYYNAPAPRIRSARLFAAVKEPVVVPVRSKGSHRYHAQDELGQYHYGYSNSDGHSKTEIRGIDGGVAGKYSYYDPEGKYIELSYVADKDGFRASGAHLPKGPQLPKLPNILESRPDSAEVSQNVAQPIVTAPAPSPPQGRPVYVTAVQTPVQPQLQRDVRHEDNSDDDEEERREEEEKKREEEEKERQKEEEERREEEEKQREEEEKEREEKQEEEKKRQEEEQDEDNGEQQQQAEGDGGDGGEGGEEGQEQSEDGAGGGGEEQQQGGEGGEEGGEGAGAAENEEGGEAQAPAAPGSVPVAAGPGPVSVGAPAVGPVAAPAPAHYVAVRPVSYQPFVNRPPVAPVAPIRAGPAVAPHIFAQPLVVGPRPVVAPLQGVQQPIRLVARPAPQPVPVGVAVRPVKVVQVARFTQAAPRPVHVGVQPASLPLQVRPGPASLPLQVRPGPASLPLQVRPAAPASLPIHVNVRPQHSARLTVTPHRSLLIPQGHIKSGYAYQG